MARAALDPERVDALRRMLAAHVAAGELPGLVAVVARGDDAHVLVLGTAAVDDPTPLGRDALFRIASITKPIAAVAALVLVERRVLDLDGPVDGLLPELADRRVLARVDAPLDDTVPAARSITLRDLLTFRLGFGTVLAGPDAYPIQRAEAALELRTLTAPWPPTPHGPDAWLARFATLPLIDQPGATWRYNTGAQVLGILLERAAGAPLEDALRALVLDPLGMADTRFSVPPDGLHRLPPAYTPTPDGGLALLDPGGAGSWWASPPALPSAASWLVSTADDLLAFARMLLAGGVHDGRRVLSAHAVAQLSADHLTPVQRAAAAPFVGPGRSWGLGLSVPAADADPPVGPPFGIGWDGGTGTSWRSDPRTGVTGILLTQRALTSPAPAPLARAFWDGVETCLASA